MPPSSTTIPKAVHPFLALLFDTEYFWVLVCLVIFGDALLIGLIIKYVPYTEIDWQTYMIQTKVFLSGEHNYSQITGPTGPLVYPAGHVRIHELLYQFTDAGKDVRLAQYVYGSLYLATLALSCAIYRSAGNVPNWIILLLPLSKRLHSIFVLRLFNDCWAVALVQLSILLIQNNLFDAGILVFSAALSVKMSILLYLPGLLVILFLRKGLVSTLRLLSTVLATQALIARPFLKEDPWAYARFAFDFGRVFLYKWTVNWRFLDEQTFLSKQLAISLLIGHFCIIAIFGMFRWCKLYGGLYKIIIEGFKWPLRPVDPSTVTADYIATVLFTSNLVGILFARSLHYQFYSWYAQQIPFLAWRTRYPVIIKFILVLGIEYAWNTFPSTPVSSGVLLGCNTMLLFGIWFGFPVGKRKTRIAKA